MTAISPPQCEGCFPFPNSPRSPTAQTYFLDDHFDPPKSPMYDYPSEQSPSPTISSAPSSRPPSPDFARTIPEQLPHSPSTLSSLSLDVADDDSDDHDYDDNELILPSFDTHPPAVKEHTPPEPRDVPSETATNSPNSKCQIRAADDASVEAEPSRHVDYLSHEWKEEDIWSSWRYVAARKHDYSNGVRLENATWRTWTKIRLKLETVSPEALNWSVPHIV